MEYEIKLTCYLYDVGIFVDYTASMYKDIVGTK